ncbi:MAG: hypothetical protein LUC49_04085 [Prevotella sp.]|nr:hypothetical protein [Prevotella sp.]
MRTYTIVNSTVSKLYSFSSEPPILESGAFAGSIGVAFVPEDAGATYASTAVWSDLSNIIEMTVTIPMTTDEGYVTRYSPYSYVLEKGLKGGVITDADAEGALTIDWLYDGDSDDATKYTVPADLAILIKGPENATSESAENHSFVNWTINTDNDTYPKPDKNMLYGSQTAVTTYVPDENSDDYRFYKLAYFYPEIIDEETGEGTGEYDYDNGTLGFYWGDTEGDNATNCGGPFTNGAKLAWLAIPKETTDSSGDAKISFYPLEGENDIEPDNNATDNETTGISAASADVQVATKTIYNLQGVRVGDMSKKGIYIVDGRKVVKQ